MFLNVEKGQSGRFITLIGEYIGKVQDISDEAIVILVPLTNWGPQIVKLRTQAVLAYNIWREE